MGLRRSRGSRMKGPHHKLHAKKAKKAAKHVHVKKK
jgi:hypothetical protein